MVGIPAMFEVDFSLNYQKEDSVFKAGKSGKNRGKTVGIATIPAIFVTFSLEKVQTVTFFYCC
jgi:hypothetical protein